MYVFDLTTGCIAITKDKYIICWYSCSNIEDVDKLNDEDINILDKLICKKIIDNQNNKNSPFTIDLLRKKWTKLLEKNNPEIFI